MNGYEKMNELLDIMGETELLNALLLALSEQEQNENADYIARMNGIDFYEDEDEE